MNYRFLRALTLGWLGLAACGGRAETSERCGAGTHDERGECVAASPPSLVCSAGTHAKNGACVTDAAPLDDAGAADDGGLATLPDASDASSSTPDYLTACLGEGDRFLLDGEAGNALGVSHLRSEGREGWTLSTDPASATDSAITTLQIANSEWRVTFSASAFTEAASRTLRVATYRDAELAGSESPNHPGLNVVVNGGACDRVVGQFSILQMDVTAEDGGGRTVRTFTAAFEEHCGDATSPAVRGCVHLAEP